MNTETPFQSGESNEVVVRVGDTVRRSIGPNSERAHSILDELEKASFDLAPKYLGIDEKGREIITYIDGEPIHTEMRTPEVIDQSFKALRRFHDILSDTELKEDQETVCHRDYAPWNVLARNNQVVGVVDFDDAYPGKRITDFVYACWTFLDLGNTGKSTEEQIKRILAALDSYGELDSTEFVPELLKEQSRILEYRKSRVAEVVNDDEKAARQAQADGIQREMDWVKENKEGIELAIKQESQ